MEKASNTTVAADDEKELGNGKATNALEMITYGTKKDILDLEDSALDSTNATVAAPSDDPGPPPDGGWMAWTQVLMAHIIIFNTWGYINSFGVFQVYLEGALDRPPSDISWVGSIQIFLLFSIGTVSGRATDAGYFRITFAAGWILQIVGLFMTSLSKTYWQLFLAQGICTGIGNGLVFCPSLAILTTYFLKRRALAVGTAGSGAATGGVVYPLIAQHLLPKLGFGWTVRIMGFILLVTMIFPLILMRTRLPPRKTGSLVDLSAFKEVPYLLFAIGNSLCFLGLYFAIYYVSRPFPSHLMFPEGASIVTDLNVTSQISAYGIATFHVSEYSSITILIILNGAGLPGRLLPNFISDLYLGPLNTMIYLALITSVLIYTWIAIAPPQSSIQGFEAFAAFYGFFASGVLSVFPSVCGSLTPPDKLQTAGIRLGMIMTCISFSVLIGPPIGGALISADKGRYLGAQIFFGTVTLLALGFLIALRFVRVGPKILQRI